MNIKKEIDIYTVMQTEHNLRVEITKLQSINKELVEALKKYKWFLQGETPPTIDKNTIVWQIDQALAKAGS